MSYDFDVIIIGAGAAGMMCAIEAGKRDKKVWLIDHAKNLGEKIRISGGGRCNFTNIDAQPKNYISQNPHFCKSALKQYTSQDFIALVDKHGIAHHEKTLGQLFCNDSATQIIDMLRYECEMAGVRLQMETAINNVHSENDLYLIDSTRGKKSAPALVIASGGLSIPKIGATAFGYNIARQFGLPIIDTCAALVPLTFQEALLAECKNLSGVSVEAAVIYGKTRFAEGMLFTHHGLSGPSILQISSYWEAGNMMRINLAPRHNMVQDLTGKKAAHPRQDIVTVLSDILPKRLSQSICDRLGLAGRIAEISNKNLTLLAEAVNDWQVAPSGTQGYRIAEVTLGGVDTNALSSKTMEARTQKGLYFIGEVVDVTGWLGGYNFQWAWASGWVAGQNV